MKTLLQAPTPDFDIYIAKGDTRWAKREGDEPLAPLYDRGYLPYSGARYLQNIFYQGRSARILLPQFEPSSENRRIARKFDGTFTKERVAYWDFKQDEAFFAFCTAYFSQKHGARAMPRERLETILQSGLISEVLVYKKEGSLVAYVLEVNERGMGHYWFSFYDMAYTRQSLGVWLMLDALRDAKAAGKTHYYLGTVYGEKALYKTNFSPLQWWGGESWSDDIRLLKELE